MVMQDNIDTCKLYFYFTNTTGSYRSLVSSSIRDDFTLDYKTNATNGRVWIKHRITTNGSLEVYAFFTKIDIFNITTSSEKVMDYLRSDFMASVNEEIIKVILNNTDDFIISTNYLDNILYEVLVKYCNELDNLINTCNSYEEAYEEKVLYTTYLDKGIYKCIQDNEMNTVMQVCNTNNIFELLDCYEVFDDELEENDNLIREDGFDYIRENAMIIYQCNCDEDYDFIHNKSYLDRDSIYPYDDRYFAY